MESVDTLHPTKVYRDYIVDPSIMDKIVVDSDEKRSVVSKITLNLITIIISSSKMYVLTF